MCEGEYYYGLYSLTFIKNGNVALAANVKNKYSMDLKTRIFDEVAAARTGQKTVNDATNFILDLLDVVWRSEQLLCCCDNANSFKEMEEGKETCSQCGKPY